MRSLAKQASLGIGSVSRIENNQADSTLDTLFRLCRAFDISLDTLMLAVRDQPISTKYIQPKSSGKTKVLTLEDILAFERLYDSSQHDRSLSIITNLFNKIALDSWTLEDKLPAFTNETLRILFTDALFYNFSITYPPSISTNDIKQIFLENGIITTADVGNYIRVLALTAGETMDAEPITLSKTSRAVLERIITHPDITTSIKFSSALALNDAFTPDGLILALFWKSAELVSIIDTFPRKVLPGGLSVPKNTVQLFTAIIFGWRWLQFKDRDADIDSWIDELRDAIK